MMAVVLGPLGPPLHLIHPGGHSSRTSHSTSRPGLARAQPLDEYGLPDRPHFTNAFPGDFPLENPDGTIIEGNRLFGSPHYNRMEDSEGYTILFDEQDGYVKYADIDGKTGRLVPTKYPVGGEDPETGEKVDPKKLRLTRRAQPSKEVIEKDCGLFCEEEVNGKEGKKEKPAGKPDRCRGLVCSLNQRRLTEGGFGSIIKSMLRGGGTLSDYERDELLEDSYPNRCWRGPRVLQWNL